MIAKEKSFFYINIQEKLIPTLICFLLICFRNVDFLIHPIFSQEEGSIMFARAYHLGWDSLFMPHGGYWQFFQNFITIISAKYFSLENAPILTTYLSIIVNITPVLLIYYGKSLDFLSNINKFFVSILIVLSMPANFSYSITNSHFVLGLIVALVLFTDYNRANSFSYFVSILFIIISGLSGVIPVMLAPLFLLKYFQSKNKTILIQLLLIMICFFVQIYFFSMSYFQNDEYVHIRRFNNFNLEYISFKFIISFLVSNFSSLNENINRPLMLVSLVAFLWICYKNRAQKTYLMLIFTILLTSILSMALSQSLAGGARYFYVSNIFFAVIVCYYYQQTKFKIFNWLIILFITFSGLDYKTSHVQMQWMKKIYWKEEVKNYRNNPSYPLNIYPVEIAGNGEQTNWSIILQE